MRHLLKEPLIHFLLIATIIFTSYNLLVTKTDKLSSDTIIITQAELDLTSKHFKQIWNRLPDDNESKHLMDDLIYSKALEREAIILGLDQGDDIIRQRLRVKMEFLLNSMLPRFEPSEEEIKTFYDANKKRFSTPAYISFTQIHIDKQRTEAEVNKLISKLNTSARAKEIISQGKMTRSLKLATVDVVDGLFGSGVFPQLMKLEQGIWDGPIESASGMYIFYITEKKPAMILPYSQARKKVYDVMEQDHRIKAMALSKAEIIKKYHIQYPMDDK